jgi:hypothetical protein
MGNAAAATTSDQSGLLKVEQIGAVLTVGLNRPAKRNALNDGIILAHPGLLLEHPGRRRRGGDPRHRRSFLVGLDLSELTEHDATEACGIRRCGTAGSTGISNAVFP